MDTDGASERSRSTLSQPADMVVDGEDLVVHAVDWLPEKKKKFVQFAQLKDDCKWVWWLIQVW